MVAVVEVYDDTNISTMLSALLDPRYTIKIDPLQVKGPNYTQQPFVWSQGIRNMS